MVKKKWWKAILQKLRRSAGAKGETFYFMIFHFMKEKNDSESLGCSLQKFGIIFIFVRKKICLRDHKGKMKGA